MTWNEVRRSWKTLDEHIRGSPNGPDDDFIGCSAGVDDFRSNTLSNTAPRCG